MVVWQVAARTAQPPAPGPRLTPAPVPCTSSGPTCSRVVFEHAKARAEHTEMSGKLLRVSGFWGSER